MWYAELVENGWDVVFSKLPLIINIVVGLPFDAKNDDGVLH